MNIPAGIPTGPVSAPIPKEAKLFRAVETSRNKDLPGKLLPYWYGKHPFPTRRRRLPLKIPGEVQNSTKREVALRNKLKKGQIPEPEEFDKVIQVFAQRARQDVRWLAVQRREFLRRAKRWASEMSLQELVPSLLSVRLLLLGCASVGDTAGASFWLEQMEKQGRAPGRLEFNCMIQAHGAEGLPEQAYQWLTRMREAGFAPDPSSYAGVIDAWEKIGNRKRMLQTVLEMRQAEAEGALGEPLNEKDAAAPYYALARTYMKVGDTPRTIAILKYLKEREVPLSFEAHKIRLEANMKVQNGPRKSRTEIERALADVLRERPEGRPIFTDKFAARCKNAIGAHRFKEILEEQGANEADVVAELPGDKAVDLWRRATVDAAKRAKNSGTGGLYVKKDDRAWIKKRLAARRSTKMGETRAGFRVPGSKGLPEWMTLSMPEKFA